MAEYIIGRTNASNVHKLEKHLELLLNKTEVKLVSSYGANGIYKKDRKIDDICSIEISELSISFLHGGLSGENQLLSVVPMKPIVVKINKEMQSLRIDFKSSPSNVDDKIVIFIKKSHFVRLSRRLHQTEDKLISSYKEHKIMNESTDNSVNESILTCSLTGEADVAHLWGTLEYTQNTNAVRSLRKSSVESISSQHDSSVFSHNADNGSGAYQNDGKSDEESNNVIEEYLSDTLIGEESSKKNDRIKNSNIVEEDVRDDFIQNLSRTSNNPKSVDVSNGSCPNTKQVTPIVFKNVSHYKDLDSFKHEQKMQMDISTFTKLQNITAEQFLSQFCRVDLSKMISSDIEKAAKLSIDITKIVNTFEVNVQKLDSLCEDLINAIRASSPHQKLTLINDLAQCATSMKSCLDNWMSAVNASENSLVARLRETSHVVKL